jgi:hypothetical protein
MKRGRRLDPGSPLPSFTPSQAPDGVIHTFMAFMKSTCSTAIVLSSGSRAPARSAIPVPPADLQKTNPTSVRSFVARKTAKTKNDLPPRVPRVRSPRPLRSCVCSPRLSPFIPSARSPHEPPPPRRMSSAFSFCSTIAPTFSARICASCWGRVGSMRWKIMTPADWSSDAGSSSVQIIRETIELTARRSRENVRSSSDSDRVL